MSITNSDVMRYQTTPVKPSRKIDLMVISEMKSFKILRFLAYRHRVGLLMCSVFLLLSYLTWDKLGRLFF